MPDISVCVDDACPSKERCFRHEASGTVPDPVWQSWADYTALRAGRDKCEQFIDATRHRHHQDPDHA